MIEYNPEEVYEKEFGIPAFNGDGNNTLHFNIWMRERNKGLVVTLNDLYKHYESLSCGYCEAKEFCDDTKCIMYKTRKIIEHNTGKKIEEVLK